jgi:hypothetical protein
MRVDSYAAGAVLVTASAVAAIAGLILLRRFGYFRSLRISHEASGQYLTIVGTLYAVLLGLIVVDAMARFQTAVTLVGDETNALAELVYLSGRMPEPQKADVRRRATEYAQMVTDREWPMMAQGQYLSEARQACLEMMNVARDWEPTTESEKAVYAECIEAASDLWNARRLRIIASERGIPPLEWCAVILGGIVTVGLTYFLVLDDLRIQVALTAMVAVLISLNIFLVLMFGYPFSGDLQVSSEGFQVALAGLSLPPQGSPR